MVHHWWKLYNYVKSCDTTLIKNRRWPKDSSGKTEGVKSAPEFTRSKKTAWSNVAPGFLFQYILLHVQVWFLLVKQHRLSLPMVDLNMVEKVTLKSGTLFCISTLFTLRGEPLVEKYYVRLHFTSSTLFFVLQPVLLHFADGKLTWCILFSHENLHFL